MKWLVLVVLVVIGAGIGLGAGVGLDFLSTLPLSLDDLRNGISGINADQIINSSYNPYNPGFPDSGGFNILDGLDNHKMMEGLMTFMAFWAVAN
jgi:hypothetical protein